MLVVSQRPLELGGGGSVRWRHLRRALAQHGWRVVECSRGWGSPRTRAAPTRAARRLAARRAQVMAVAGGSSSQAVRPLRVKPEALAPNNLWALTGRRAVREAIERERPDVVVATSPPPSGLLAAAAVIEDIPFVADVRDLWAGNPYSRPRQPSARGLARPCASTGGRGRDGDRGLPCEPTRAPRGDR